jgi:hypothetical protein
MEDILFTKEDTDSIVLSIVKKFKDRAIIGKEKYGTDLDRSDLSLTDWLQHAQEEHMDAILYLEKIKKIIENKIIIEKDSEKENNIIVINKTYLDNINYMYSASMSLIIYSICLILIISLRTIQ